MSNLDLIVTAIANTLHSKSRTILTVLAIFVGAFTLTITNGLGTGINNYIDDTVASVGASDVLTVTKPSTVSENDSSDASDDDAPAEYDPDAIETGGQPGATVTALTSDDIDALAAIDGVLEVQASRSVSPDYIRFGDGTRYVLTVGNLIDGQDVQLSAGTEPDAGSVELDLPAAYVEPLGFDDADDAVGETVTIGVTDADRVEHLIDATIAGVTDNTFALAGSGITASENLIDALFDAENIGVPEEEQDRFARASVWFDEDSTDTEVSDLQDRLSDAGYDSTTVAEQLGSFNAVIDAILLVLNAFAVIALLAASFGIVNTLLMSVKERTREIGLMKAMGMSSGRVFGLFSLEAMFIGLMGSALGVAVGMLAGTAASSTLTGALLADLPGLTLIAFDPGAIVGIILGVMAIAFVAGTLPAARAAGADPVESLRYE